MALKIVFTGGGTGGHIFPIVAVVREIKKITQSEQVALYYLGANDKIGFVSSLKKEGVKVKTILTGKIRRHFDPLALIQNFIDVFVKIPLGIVQSFFSLFFMAPDVIFSKGGYGSLPVVFAGFVLRVPIFLHESDSKAGLVNRILVKFAMEVFVSFPKTKKFPANKMLVVGNPIRTELLKGSVAEGQKLFQITGKKPVILIIGGSQGAESMNNLILDILPEWLESFELIHLTGQHHYESIKKEVQVLLSPELKKYYHPVSFLEEGELKSAFAVSHLIISRAGAGSIFEIAALGKPSILIPLPAAAQNHQLKNAYALLEAGATIVIEQANLTPHLVLRKTKHIFSRPEDFKELSQKAWNFAKPKAGKIIAEYIMAYLTN